MHSKQTCPLSQRETIFITLNSKQTCPGCEADIISPTAICYTDIFEKVIWTQRAVNAFACKPCRNVRVMENFIPASGLWKYKYKTGIQISNNHNLTVHCTGLINWIILFNFEHHIFEAHKQIRGHSNHQRNEVSRKRKWLRQKILEHSVIRGWHGF